MTGFGIDGCRGGWVLAIWDLEMVRFEVQPRLADLGLPQRAGRVFVDMPIGLPESEPRRCDTLARRLLGRRASTVFPVPCRRALYTADYAQACRINEAVLGRRLSRQSWNLVPKIIELDRLLEETGMGDRLIESHPELDFAGLNAGVPVPWPKRSAAGRQARLALLGTTAAGAILGAMDTLRSRGAAVDDLIDATVLALSAAAPAAALETLPEPPPRDALDLSMAITRLLPSTAPPEG